MCYRGLGDLFTDLEFLMKFILFVSQFINCRCDIRDCQLGKNLERFIIFNTYNIILHFRFFDNEIQKPRNFVFINLII